MRAQFAWMAIGAACAALGCTATTPDPISKEEAAARTVRGETDGIDFCETWAWYGDGECDTFCPLVDQDCTGAECTVGADSTCLAGTTCLPGICYHYCAADDPACCDLARCVPSDFCPRARCPGGTRCDEERNECVADEPDFCTDAFCGPGTRCNEALDRCVDDDPSFCTDALCGPGTRCDEATDSCVADDPDFCRSAFCGPGTRCDEATDSCVPFAGCREIGCARHCEYGFRLGPDGCPTCDCNTEPVPCNRRGCSGRLCVPEGFEPILTTCDDRPSDVCYDIGTCERQPEGHCGWTTTPEFAECMAPFSG